MEPDTTFPERSFVLARLLLEPVYREDGALWEVLCSERDAIIRYFHPIGQEVVIDEGEAWFARVSSYGN